MFRNNSQPKQQHTPLCHVAANTRTSNSDPNTHTHTHIERERESESESENETRRHAQEQTSGPWSLGMHDQGTGTSPLWRCIHVCARVGAQTEREREQFFPTHREGIIEVTSPSSLICFGRVFPKAPTSQFGGSWIHVLLRFPFWTPQRVTRAITIRKAPNNTAHTTEG